MRFAKLFFSSLLIVLLLAACSRKKSTFFTRNYHAVTAEYNALYNGNNAFVDGQEQLANAYRDNYWEILPIERMEQEDEETKPGYDKNPNFERAEEKATKAIQKHSIVVDDKEHNPQIDEAYILLGKARYFDGRFIPALDAFNYVLNRYPTSNNINRAKMWKAKTNIRLRYEEIALRDLGGLINAVDNKNIKMKDDEYADANAIMAQAWVNLDSLEAALPYIKIASEVVPDNELKGRYSYIKGQIYDRLSEVDSTRAAYRDSANMAYDEVIALNRKSPRVYMINAYISKAKNFDYEGGDRIAFLELLEDLEENWENRPYLDKIYNQIGEYYLKTENVDTAVAYFNRSIRAYDQDRTLQSVNYNTLAEINFDAADYKTAGAYYDSTLAFVEPKSKVGRRVQKKRDNLEVVIKLEEFTTVTDSILKIANMSEEDQLRYFTFYTDELRAKAIADSVERANEDREKIANQEFYSKPANKEKSSGPNAGPFYFYNTSTVAYGKQQFRNIWGDRKLEDGWRISSSTPKFKEEGQLAKELQEPTIAGNPLYDPETYLVQIPKDRKIIDSLARERDMAYYELGLIYKEKFKELPLAADRFETLLGHEPIERLILPVNYNLYKIYEELERPALGEPYKNRILDDFPDSRYASIIRNPEQVVDLEESAPEYKYNQLYKRFEAFEYTEVIHLCDKYVSEYFGDPIVPKFEFLKATALGRRNGFESYKYSINYVATTYPNTDEGRQAREIYATTIPALEKKDFKPESGNEKWKVVYRFDKDEREEAEELLLKLKESIAYYNNQRDMKASLDYYDQENWFVVLHGLRTKLGARNRADALSENKNFKITHPFFEISTPNYKIIQVHKNLKEYLASDPTLQENGNPQK
ncbi:tetratricopeptide repeat protein [Aureitalea marina]|uniref:Gliding motility protein n=1 Tax=Aureitalea marina TaxID=930804 RepID=A0A2S7KS94_9FLAO|nr:tetratricopeptide repeat protein [Aureitalea marina]PQB05502.1 hypothetical protein BST85_11815 [Aureitalea marina]